MANADNQIGAIVNIDKVANFINNSKTTQKVLRAVSDHPALASAGVAFVASSMLRSTAQAALPIKNKEDKRYTIASSIATGVTELGLSAALFIPANKLIQKTSKALYSSTKDTIYKENSMLLRSFKSLSNRFLKIALMPATAWLRFAAIVPCVKLLFGKKKEEKKVGGTLDYEG